MGGYIQNGWLGAGAGAAGAVGCLGNAQKQTAAAAATAKL